MKRFKKIVIVTILVILPQFLSIAQIPNVTSSFIANTFNGDNEKWVQNYAEELDVASDGTMITASEWDEAGRCVGIFKDGQPVTFLKPLIGNCWGAGTSTKAIAVNNSNLYINNCEGNILIFNRLSNYQYITKVNTGIAEGMTCGSNALYLIKPDGVVQKRNLTSLGTVALTFTVAGGYDLAVDTSGNIWVLTSNNEVLKYNAQGIATGIKIANQNKWQPSAINYDAHNNLILIPDNGPRRQVIKYNTLGVQVGTFGNEGGISAAPEGKIGDLRFWNISGSGTDSLGNMYVALNENAVSLRKFNALGVKQWEVQGMMFTDLASFDPASDATEIYGVSEKMEFDYNTQQWSLNAITCDKIKYQYDPRNISTGTSMSVALMRRVNGNLLMFVTGMYNDYFDVYYFDGEIAVHSNNFSNIGWAIFPDNDGNIWYEKDSKIFKIPLSGFDNNKPVFGTEIEITSSILEPFTKINRLVYDVDKDIMFVGGFTANKPDLNDGTFGLLGSTIARYPNWSLGNKTNSHTVFLKPDDAKYYPKSMSVANDYIFVGSSLDRAKLNVYGTDSLNNVGFIAPPTIMNERGWLDMPFSINATQRLNGIYSILVEENYRGKNILYQWQANPKKVLCDTIKLTSFNLNTKNIILNGSGIKNLSVNILPDTACRNIKWKSLNRDIVFVSANGKINGITPGIAKIVASTDNEKYTDTCTVTVEDVACTKIDIKDDSISLNYRQKYQLKLAFEPLNALNKECTWYSLDSTKVSVDRNGFIHANEMGNKTAIVVTSQSNNLSDTCWVSVPLIIREPYNGIAKSIPGIIESELFDVGLDELSYHDIDIENQGDAFRSKEPVDIENCLDINGGYNIGWTFPNEWLKYYVNVESGLYDITARVAAPSSGSTFSLHLNDTLITTFGLPGSGDWQNWISVNKFDIPMEGGLNKTLKFHITKGDFNINYLNFQKAIPIQVFNIIPDTLKVKKLSTDSNLVVDFQPSNTLRKKITWKISNATNLYFSCIFF